MPAQPAEPSTKSAPTSNPPLAPPRGRHDSAKRTTARMMTCRASVTSTPAILAPMSRRVPSGVTWSRPQDAVAALEARRDRQGDQ